MLISEAVEKLEQYGWDVEVLGRRLWCRKDKATDYITAVTTSVGKIDKIVTGEGRTARSILEAIRLATRNGTRNDFQRFAVYEAERDVVDVSCGIVCHGIDIAQAFVEMVCRNKRFKQAFGEIGYPYVHQAKRGKYAVAKKKRLMLYAGNGKIVLPYGTATEGGLLHEMSHWICDVLKLNRGHAHGRTYCSVMLALLRMHDQRDAEQVAGNYKHYGVKVGSRFSF